MIIRSPPSNCQVQSECEFECLAIRTFGQSYSTLELQVRSMIEIKVRISAVDHIE